MAFHLSSVSQIYMACPECPFRTGNVKISKMYYQLTDVGQDVISIVDSKNLHNVLPKLLKKKYLPGHTFK